MEIVTDTIINYLLSDQIIIFNLYCLSINKDRNTIYNYR